MVHAVNVGTEKKEIRDFKHLKFTSLKFRQNLLEQQHVHLLNLSL